jgi:hypothetical protein
MKKNNTILILILSIIATIISILVFIFFLKIIENKNQHASVVLTTLQDKMTQKENSKINASKITETKLIEDTINSYFVDPDRIDTFVSYLEGIGSSFSSIVSVESIEIPQKTKNIISVKLSITGTFEEIMKTIAFLENIPYQVNITQIYLNKNANQVSSDNIKAPTQTKIPKVTIWQANISFNILSLN